MDKWNTIFGLIGVIMMVSLVIAQLPTITNSGRLLVDGETKTLIYDFDWGRTTITLEKAFANYTIKRNKTIGKEIVFWNETRFNYTALTDIMGYVSRNGSTWDYTFVDLSAGEELSQYKLIINSTEDMLFLEEEGFNKEENFTYKYPMLINYHLNPACENELEVGGDCQDFRHIFDFAEDTCSHNYSNCGYTWRKDSTEIFFNSYKNIVSKSVSVGACRTLDVNGETYIQSGNIVQSSNADCIIINADNVEFDGNGYSITSGYSRSGITTSSDYLSPEIHHTNINMGGSAGAYGIELVGSSGTKVSDAYIHHNILQLTHRGLAAYYMINSRLENNRILTNTEDGIYFWNCDNNNIVDTEITSAAGGKNSDIYSRSDSDANVFLNATYDTAIVDSGTYLFRRWYYRAFVNNSCGDLVDGATVKVWDIGVYTTLTSGADGYTSIYNITDYIHQSGTKYTYSPYKINVTHSDYIIKQDLLYNVTVEENDLKDVYTFTELDLSSVNNINCSCGYNFTTNQNISIDTIISLIDDGITYLNANWSSAGAYELNFTGVCELDIDLERGGIR